LDEIIDCRVSRLTGHESHRFIENEILGKKLLELKDEIQKALKEGKNLLKLLNRGEITLKELE
jgi:hypothetical protein